MSSGTLVVQTAFLGDVILATPLLSALAEQHGPVDVVTTPLAAPLLETHPAVRQVFAYDKRRADRGWGGLRRLARRLRTERYARAVLPHRSLRTAALALLARIPSRVGFSGPWSFLYTDARPKPRTGHETYRLLALANGASGVYRPHLRPTPEDEQRAAALIPGDFVDFVLETLPECATLTIELEPAPDDPRGFLLPEVDIEPTFNLHRAAMLTFLNCVTTLKTKPAPKPLKLQKPGIPSPLVVFQPECEKAFLTY